MRPSIPLAVAGTILFCSPTATAQGVVINEVVYDGVGGDNGQSFVEIYGPAGTNLSGWTIASIEGGSAASGGTCNTQAAQVLTFPPGTIIPFDGFLVVADDDGAGGTLVANADLIGEFDPENGADAIVLCDALGYVADAVAYGPIDTTNPTTAGCTGVLAGQPWFEGNPARDVFAPLSLERCPAGVDTGDNDSDFTPTAPTPGYGQVCCNAIEFVSMGALNNPSVGGGDAVGLDVWMSCSANRGYLILWSATDPGSALVPVVIDPLTSLAATFANLAPFVGWFGTLDGNGRALGTASLDFSPAATYSLGGAGPIPTWVGVVALSLAGLQFANNVPVTLNN